MAVDRRERGEEGKKNTEGVVARSQQSLAAKFVVPFPPALSHLPLAHAFYGNSPGTLM